MTVTVTPVERDVLTLSGPETLAYLQGQLSQDVAGLAVGDVTWAFVLQPQGKVDAWVRVDRAGVEEVRLDVDAGQGEALLARLTRFKLRTKTDLVLTPSVPVLAIRGAEVADGLPCGWPGVVGSDLFDPIPDEPPADLPPGAVTLDDEGYEALRIAAGMPIHGAEISTDTIPAELGQWVIDASVSFTKGCFTGQELVARIDSRGGNVPRHLRGLVVAGLESPAPGDTVVAEDGREVGIVTSSAQAADGRLLALALVHRSIEPPATVTVDGFVTEVTTLPIPD